MTITWPVPEDGKALKISEVPESYTDDGERKMYLGAYNKFYGKRIARKDSKPAKCAEGSHSAARSAVRKGRQASKAGARNSAPDMKMIQDIHDKAFSLGAICEGDEGKDAKALDLERQAYKVRHAWMARFNPPPDEDYVEDMKYWIRAVFGEFVLVEDMSSSDLFKYDYSLVDGEITFSEPVQVEMEFVEVGKTAPVSAPERKKIEIRWTCAITGHEHGSPEEALACIDQTTLNTSHVRMEFVKSLYSGNSLKTVAKTDEHLIVANYLILFGGRDLEGVASARMNADGTRGEYFTKSTDFTSQYTDTGQLLIDWEHRTQPDGVGPGKEDIFGFVDWKTAIVDEVGLFARRVLNRRNRYVKMLEALLDAGMIGSSTEPVQEGVVKGSDGEIREWPLKRDSFSVSPMDPRMLTVNHLEIVKALREDPVGKDVYQTVFNTEAARAKARALSLISQIGEMSYELH